MTPKPFALMAVLCALAIVPQTVSADCLSTIWSTRQSRADSQNFVRDLQTVDFDGDGKLDLVGIVEPASGTNRVLSTWRGLGDGTFAPPVTLATSSFNHLEVADINNDGLADLIVSTDTSQILVRLGNGGGFDDPITKDLDYIANRFVLVHLNGDEFADLVTLSSGSGVIAVHHGDGHGHFTETYRFSPNAFGWAIAAADFDGDGLTDIAYGIRSPTGAAGSVNVAFQKADGTFQQSLTMPVPDFPEALAIGDLNEDGRPDLVTIIYNAALAGDPAVAVFRNLGSRNFDRSDLSLSLSRTVGNLFSLRIADVNGDHHLDIITAGVNGGYVLTYAGMGDGTFRSPTYFSSPDSAHIESLALGDFDGDLVPDLAVGAYQRFIAATASCGTHVYLYTVSPVITLGQSAPLRALVSSLSASTPTPRGTVTFREGTTALGTADVDAAGDAQLDASGLTLGTHTLTADFAGNSEAPAGTSAGIVQNVISGASTTTLTFPPTQSVFGTPYTFSVDIRSQFGTQIGACFLLNVDGAETTRCSSPLNVTLNLTPGPHTLSATFQGNSFAPPSTSGPQVITTARATPGFTKSGGTLTVRAGESYSLQFSLTGITGPGGAIPSGSVQLLQGNTLLGSGTIAGNLATVSATLARGEYDILAVYSGDSNFNSATLNLRLDVLPNVPLAIHARSLTNAISIRAVLPPNTTSTSLYRRVAGSGNTWQLVTGWNVETEFDSTSLSRGVLYDYWLFATVSGNSQSSNVDSALLFTDDPVVPGTTNVRHIHFDEARLLVNALRASADLAPFNFDSTYADFLIRASHLASLRAALSEARQALGMPAPTFTDTAAAGLLLKALHLTEIRQQSQ